MIRYPITKAKLEADIEAEKPGWLTKAKQKTAAFRKAKDFNEPATQNSWSEIKAVYMKLQHNKCAYCERVLGSAEFSKIEHDVEHFRPKNAVKAWPTAKMKQDTRYNYGFSTGDKTDKGYYLLAYNILNYATACKTCNSSFKSNYFPIAGTRVPNSTDFKKLKTEAPYLVYPLSEVDDDPADLLTFEGILPVPKMKAGANYRRARITIDFFALDYREDLVQERAEVIRYIWLAILVLDNQQATAKNREFAKVAINKALSENAKHSACANAFYNLCQTDRTLAEKFAVLAEQLM